MTPLSLQQKHLAFLLFFAMLIVVVTLTFDLIYSEKAQKENFKAQYKLVASMLAQNFTPVLLFEDKEGAKLLLDQIKINHNIQSMTLFLQNGHTLAEYSEGNPQRSTFQQNKNAQLYFKKIGNDPLDYGVLFVHYPIYHDALYIGQLSMQVSTLTVTSSLKKRVAFTLIFSLVLYIVLYFLVRHLSKQITHPITALATLMTSIDKEQNFRRRIHETRSDEIGQLYEAINHLLEGIEQSNEQRNSALANAYRSTKELEQLTAKLEERVQERTKKLNDSLKSIKKTHEQLVESEKMAALGTLVSGVSHEINTPLGNAVTASSLIQSESKQIAQALEDGTLKQSELIRSLQTITQSATLLDNSLKQAATLVKSFKQISIDQSSEFKRSVALHDYIHDIMLTFHSKLKQHGVVFNNQIEPTITVYLEAGILAQLCNNLIQNSLIHAFTPSIKTPTITFNATLTATHWQLIYHDNGVGINESVAANLFDPFVTTKRNDGGTGLGLSILYNLTVQKLHGTIDWQNAHPNGVTFTITIPLHQA